MFNKINERSKIKNSIKIIGIIRIKIENKINFRKKKFILILFFKFKIFISEKKKNIKNFNEYLPVKIHPKKNIRLIKIKKYLEEKNIKIKSLERNPVENIKPIKLIVEIKNEILNILFKEYLLIIRKSWIEKLNIINNPKFINNEDLKKAWNIIWINEILIIPILNLNRINPIWDKVEKAIAFLKSIIDKANIPAKKNVSNLNIIINIWTSLIKKKYSIFINIKIPAVTKVDEWTKEEIGVGADIAKGSQTPKGIWHLLVIKPKKIIKNIIIFKFIKLKFIFNDIIIEQKIINIASPIRLKKKVINLEIILFKLK